MKHPSRSSHPSHSAAAVPTQPNSATDAPVMRWFGHLLETRPMAFWSGIWVSTFLIGVVAVGSLLSPSASERRSVSAIALGSDSGVATQPLENRGKVPLWMFGAIAVTCTAGSILVSRQLKADASSTPSVPPRRRVKKARPTSPVRPPARRSATGSKLRKKVGSRQPQRLKPYSPTELPLSPPPVPMAAEPVQPPRFAPPASPQSLASPSFVVAKRGPGSNRHAVQSATPVAVTVVPAEQPHPLDWTEPRLADTLDVRKQKPMQSWL